MNVYNYKQKDGIQKANSFRIMKYIIVCTNKQQFIYINGAVLGLFFTARDRSNDSFDQLLSIQVSYFMSKIIKYILC